MDQHSPPTTPIFRRHALGVGAIIAVSRPLWERLPQLASWVVGWVGLVGIGASLFVVTEDAHFPAPWAALPVLSTAAVIAAGVARPQPYLFPIVNPVARYVGDLSYSLYLWHFPAVILLLAVWPDRGGAYYVVALLAMTGASLISFYMIEEPVRRSSFLEPGWWRSRARGHSGDVSTLQKAWLALAGVVVAVMVAVAVRTPAAPSNIFVPQLDASATDGQSLVDQQSERVVAALEAEAFPQFQPPLEDLGFDKWKSEVEKDGCTDVDLSTPQQCAFGPANAKTSVAVLGDSFAMAWMPTVRAAMGGSRIQQLTLQQCPAWDVPVHQDSGAAFPECAEFHQGAIAWINANRPDVVMLTTSYGTAPRLDSGATGRDAANEGGEGLAATLAALKPSGARMVVVSPPPATGDLQECVTRLASPRDCMTEVDDTFELTSAAEKSAAGSAGATYIPTLSWFCYAGRCPGFVGKTPVSTDGGHLTLEYAAELAPLLAEAVGSPEKS